PALVTVILYIPGSRFGATYSPAASVSKLREIPRCTSVISTEAPTTSASLGSRTSPRIRPVEDWEKTGEHTRSIPNPRSNARANWLQTEWPCEPLKIDC